MKLLPDGFLSPLMDAWSKEARDSAPEWFSLVDALNRSAVAILPTLTPRRTSSRELMTAALYARALQTFEAMAILAERGMLADAGTLARSIVETTVYLGGLAVLEDFPKRMAASSNSHYFAMGKAIAEHLEGDGDAAGETEAAELRLMVQEAKDKGYPAQDIKLRNLAREVGMDPLYEVVYRQLSGDSAHPSVTSGERHLVRGVGGRVEKLVFKPQRDGMERTLSAAITAFLSAMEAVSRVFSRPDIAATIDRYNALHQDLSGRLKR